MQKQKFNIVHAFAGVIHTHTHFKLYFWKVKIYRRPMFVSFKIMSQLNT